MPIEQCLTDTPFLGGSSSPPQKVSCINYFTLYYGGVKQVISQSLIFRVENPDACLYKAGIAIMYENRLLLPTNLGFKGSKALTYGVFCKLCDAVDVEFFHNLAAMSFDGFYAYVQF